jgi:soluble lytic murein transglycosylase
VIFSESAFDPNAYAPDGGRGLMQIMPATGARLANSLGIAPPDLDRYFQPEVNILLGTTYLKSLLQLFEYQLPPVIASYNAGEDTVGTWWNETYKDDIPRFVASIPYPVTKRYIQKVLWYYREYQRIYR